MATEIVKSEEAEVVSNLPEGEGMDASFMVSPNVFEIPKSILTSERRDLLLQYLEEQYSIAAGERRSFISKLARWKIAYAAPVPQEPKHFPIFNASNLVMPVIKEAVNVLAAQLVQATMTAQPPWVFKDMAAEWEPFTDDMEVFLQLAADRDLNLHDHAIPWIIETAKLGTGVLEHGYEFERRGLYRYSSDGGKVSRDSRVFKDGPSVRHIPLDKWWIRFGERLIQDAPWCGVELAMSETEVRRWGRKKKINVDEFLKTSGTTERNEVEQVQDDMEETKPISREVWRVYKTWLAFDVDGDGEDEEIMVYYDRHKGDLLGAYFPAFDHAKRPFVKIGYFPREDRFYDEGICEMLEGIQASISETANKRADNAAMANLKMFITKNLVKGLRPGDPLYTGKVIRTPDPYRDVREFQMAEIYPSTVSEEQIMQSRGDRVAGINEGISGSAMPVTRTTASAQLALLQEQAKRIDLAVRNVRTGMNEVGRLTLATYFQFGTGGKPIAWMGEKGRIVEAIFSIPRGLIDLGLGIKAQTPTSLQNRQVKRENKIQLYNLLVQTHKELLPFAQAFAPEYMPMVARSFVFSARKYLEDVLETFEETDPMAVLAGLSVMEKILPRAEDLGGLESFERGIVSAETLDAITRLEGTLQEAKAAAEASRGISDQRGEPRRVSAPEGVPGGDIPGLGIFELPTGPGAGGY